MLSGIRACDGYSIVQLVFVVLSLFQDSHLTNCPGYSNCLLALHILVVIVSRWRFHWLHGCLSEGTPALVASWSQYRRPCCSAVAVRVGFVEARWRVRLSAIESTSVVFSRVCSHVSHPFLSFSTLYILKASFFSSGVGVTPIAAST